MQSLYIAISCFHKPPPPPATARHIFALQKTQKMFDTKQIFNVAAGVALVMLAYWAYNKYSTPAAPAA